MVAVAAGDVIARQGLALAVLDEGDIGRFAVDVVKLHVIGLVERRRPGFAARRHQVAGEFGLAVDHDRLATGQSGEVDAHAAVLESQLEAAMRQPLGIHALADTGFAQQIDHALLEHAGTNAAQHVLAGAAF